MSGRPKRKATEKTAENAKRARGETELGHGLRWSHAGKPKGDLYPVILLDSDGTVPPASKAAGFDIDWTVIATKSGRKFATGASDWEWWDDSVPIKLKALHDDGHRILFFTNQAGIEKQKVSPKELMLKIENIIAELDIPIFAYISTGTTNYRKPSTLMWDYFVKNSNQGIEVDLSECVYVGDAAGRAKEWAPGKPRDFSCTDRMFGANIGIQFYTPEEYFLGEAPAPFKWGSLDTSQFLKTALKSESAEEYNSKDQELIIMVGPPASGKSTFAKRHLQPHGYKIINRDTLGTAGKCIQGVKDGLKAGQSLVVDNTNPSMVARSDYLQLAEKAKVPCRCFVMTTTLEVAHHLNMYRMNQTNGQVRRVPDVGYHVYNKNFQQPDESEGFDEIKKIDFCPKFDSKSDADLFKQWT